MARRIVDQRSSRAERDGSGPATRSNPGATREGAVSAARSGWIAGRGISSSHAEAVEIVFDPERIFYRELLEFFFQIHRPDLGEHLVGSSYRSEIFYTTDEQRQVAEDTIADLDAAGIWPGKVVTEVSEACPFWEAEAEDQDYLQHYPDRYTFFPRPGLEAANRETAA